VFAFEKGMFALEKGVFILEKRRVYVVAERACVREERDEGSRLGRLDLGHPVYVREGACIGVREGRDCVGKRRGCDRERA